MTVTVIIEDLEPQRLVVQLDPIAELAAFLHALLHPDHHPLAAKAREQIYAAGSDWILGRLRSWESFFGPIRTRFLLPMKLEGSLVLPFEERILQLEQLPLEQFARMTAMSLADESRSFDGENPLHRPDDFLAELKRHVRPRVALGKQIMSDPESVRQRLITFLEDTHSARFVHEWNAHLPRLVDAAETMRAEIAEHGVDALEKVSTTTMLEPDPKRIVLDKLNRARFDPAPHGVILLPSHFASPHLIAKYDRTHPLVLQYSISDREVERLGQVKHRLQALQDDARLEICRHVSRVPMTTLDLAIELQMTQPQVSRHLRALRETNLVHRERRGQHVYYSLNTLALEALGQSVIAVMQR